MPRSLDVLVVGAGVAGLSAAHALHRQGMSVDIIERREQPATGMGLFLPGNAVTALTELGLREHLTLSGSPIEYQELRDHRGKRLAEITMGLLWRPDGGCVGITHGALHAALRESLPSALRTGITVRSMAQREAGVDVEFSDGGSSRYDVVVGADGIRSETRRGIAPEVEPSYVGQVCWRFLTHNAHSIDRWTVWLGRGTTFLAVPVGKDQLYCYADVSVPSPDEGHSHASRLAEHFAEFDPVVRELLATPAARDPYFSPVEEVLDAPWTSGHVVLVGDAAHASSPNMAQGVAMAVEDALVLADCLGADDAGTTELLDRYRTRRLPRARWVQEQTHRRDRTRSAQPVLRNLLLRWKGPTMYESAYAPLRDAP